MATSGPWLEPTPWPNTWWNLNAQLEYWLIHGSNHLELDAITRALSEFRDNLAKEVAAPYRADSIGIPRTTDPHLVNGAAGTLTGYGVGIPGQDPPTPEVGDLTWALHNVWLSYRHTMDRSILRDVLFPLLRKAINYYLHFTEPGPDGKLHLPATFSPEYGGDSRDCNYDLMLLTLGLPHPPRIRRTPRHRRPVGAPLAGGAGETGAVPDGRQRLHDRRRHPVREVAPPLLASPRGLPAVRGHRPYPRRTRP